MHLSPWQIWPDSAVVKAVSRRVCLRRAASTSSSAIFSLAGRGGALLMAEFLRMHATKGSPFHQENIILVMLDSLRAIHCLCPIVVCGTISMNGARLEISSMYSSTANNKAQSHHFYRPANPKELFNLRHARLRNAIERIFGVCKRRFKLMTAAPEYSIATQAMIPCALAALHNFITIHDPDDFADEGLLDGQRGPRDTSWTLLKEYNGNLNFTTNAWTSPNHWAFIAIMVHLEMNGEPVSLLLDLVEVAESHNGLNLAVVFAGILDDYGIADKILSITCDNMSANDGMINELFKIVLWFEGQKDRVRCFAHIINLVAKSLLKQFDVPKGKEGDTMSDAEQQLAELAKDLDMEDLQTRLETSARENDDDDVEGWVNEVEEMSEAKRKAHNANIQPVSLVIVKVSTDTIYGDL
ncbi:hypothetical protein HGRIS_014896 [Hohenbuehelia grisea]|uniref:Transposase n=1 Tax=Hohenbuehelia grisea TaxID=104357 RepID=A0ABR3JN99_9AGAR